VALTTDTSILTAIAKRFMNFVRVFARQIEALGKKGDCLWVFSTSGASANVVAAVREAKNKGP